MALRPKKLAYSIAGVSSVSADYAPERIIVDNPTDTRSRWSAHQHAGTRTRQWVVLELVDEPAIISKSLTIHKPGRLTYPHFGSVPYYWKGEARCHLT